MFNIICMSLKAQISRLDKSNDLIKLFNMKMQALQGLIPNPRTKEKVTRMWRATNEFYKCYSNAELNRIRTTILNSLRTISVPVHILIEEGIQYESGYVVPRKSGQYAKKLGYCTVFGSRLKPAIENKIVMAEGDITQEAVDLEDTVNL